MKKDIANLRVNEQVFKDALKKKKSFRRKITSLFLVTTLVTGGYLLREPILRQIDIVIFHKDTPSFDELDVFFSSQGTVNINGTEYSVADLKEQYGALYNFMIPMFEEEIDAKFKTIIDYQKKLNRYYSWNDVYGDQYGFALELPFETEDNMMIHFTDYLDKIMSIGSSSPNPEFLSYVSRRISCVDPIVEQNRPRACFLNSDSDYGDYINGDKKIEDLSYENKEFEIKKTLFYFQLYYDFLTKEGYNLDDYRINQDYTSENPKIIK